MRKSLAGIGLIAAVLTFALAMFTSLFPLRLFNDFYSYYIASVLVRQGSELYGITAAFRTIVEGNRFEFLWGTGYSYPPLLAQFLAPLSFLPFRFVLVFFVFLQVFLYGLLIKTILHEVSQNRQKSLFIFLLFFGPVYGSILNGQINVVVLWFIYWYLYSANEVLRSLSLSLAGWIKVYPFLLALSNIVRTKTRFVILFVIFSLIFLCFQIIPRGGLDLWDYLFQVLPHLQTSVDPYITNQSLNGFLSRLPFLPYHFLLTTLIQLTVIIPLLLTTYKNRGSRKAIDLLWLLTVLLVAGKNSYWNMAPTLFIYVYLWENKSRLNKMGTWILACSIWMCITFPLFISAFMLYPDLSRIFVGKVGSSLGFISFALLYYPLMYMRKQEKKAGKRETLYT